MRVLCRPAGCCPPAEVPVPPSAEGNWSLLARLRAAAHPVRLQMLRLLAAADAPVCVCDITSRFRLRQPTISHHLGILRRAGLVAASRRGIWAHYAVRPEGIEVLVRGIADLRRKESP
jgi:ArsR family transcriptional regulator, arsenate/arsenite/antimonite-responsive transcriptional repressor